MYYRIIFLIFLLINFARCGTSTPLQTEDQQEPSDMVIYLPNDVPMHFMHIEPGTFMMGSELPGDIDARPQHSVTLTKDFYMGRYEVTQQQWKSVMESTPWIDFSSSVAAESVAIGDDFPATSMTWNHIQVFLRKLNEADLTAVYRLPTEAEWEYACRAGTTTPFSFSDSQNATDYLWFEFNSTEQYDRPISHPHEVGLKKPNLWGLYDMHGNVLEIVDHWDKQYPNDPQIDPQPTVPRSPIPVGSGLYDRYPTIITRGGSYLSKQDVCKSSSRLFFGGGVSGWLWSSGRKEVGFRIVRQPKNESEM